MQPTPGGGSTSASGSGGGGGGGELSRGGLARFRSAPATWLEALLEDEEEDPLLKPTQCLTQLLTEHSSPSPTRGGSVVPFGSSSADPSSFDVGLLRKNSSPADFLGNSDGFFSNFAIPASFDLAASSSAANMSAGSPTGSSSSSRLAREVETLRNFSGNLSSSIKMEQGGHVSGLTDMEMEKLLEESVPCRVRAKRGCATHPRSIAERVRRTRISDRIRKLQELVPNMDKQTNTADMLDEAVEYVKCLQKQIQELSEHQRKCQCVNKE